MRQWKRWGLLLGALVACAEPEPQPVTVDDVAASSDPFTIEGAEVVGDWLLVEVRHQGGCVEDHSYQLFWDGRFFHRDPVRAELVLVHRALGDPCHESIATTLRFGLEPLKTGWREVFHTSSGTLLLSLRGSELAIPYEF